MGFEPMNTNFADLPLRPLEYLPIKEELIFFWYITKI